MIRHPSNPVLTHTCVPYPSTCVFNAGVAKFGGEYVMIFRNDFNHIAGAKFESTSIGLARSRDGIQWTVEPKPVFDEEKIRRAWAHTHHPRFGLGEIKRVYDPRITALEDRIHLTFAVDTAHGICGAVARTDDFDTYEILSLTLPDNRNMVLFPEKIAGRYWRLDRPFPIYMRDKPEAFDIWASASPDLRYWGDHRLVLGSEEVPYANSKIGPAAPPIKTPAGWLTPFHAVHKNPDKPLFAWDEVWIKTYYAGLMLLDLEDPTRVIGLMRDPLLAPEAKYELEGFRGSVIFPCGFVLEGDEVRLYYGAADTVIGMASAPLDDLIAACKPW